MKPYRPWRLQRQFILCIITLFVSSWVCSVAYHYQPTPSPSLLILLDVDNTLYDERVHHIEREIIRGIHRFAADRFNLTSDEADELHSQYGSTVEGLRHHMISNKRNPDDIKRTLQDFYHVVYKDIDVRSLLLQSISAGGVSSSDFKTGYSQSKYEERKSQDHLRRLLNGMGSFLGVDLLIASNSPRHHVLKVLQCLGLARIPWRDIWTPDGKDSKAMYPTKADPDRYYDFSRWHSASVVLIDDSQAAIDAIRQMASNALSSIDTIRVVHGTPQDGEQNLGQKLADSVTSAVASALQFSPLCSTAPEHIDTTSKRLNDSAITDVENAYRFSQIQYLRSKNQVDLQSINRQSWRQLLDETKQLLRLCWKSDDVEIPTQEETEERRPLRIVDLGAGLLSMLRLILEGHQPDSEENVDTTVLGLPSLAEELGKSGFYPTHLHYYAYEPNQDLESECVKELESLGFRLDESLYWRERPSDSLVSPSASYPEHIFVKKLEGDCSCFVYLRCWSFEQNMVRIHQRTPSNPSPHIILGSCFADLVEPYELARSLLHQFLSQADKDSYASNTETLMYFPITFSGITQFLPSKPFGQQNAHLVPSDTLAFGLYAKALRLQGHNLDPDLLTSSLQDYGATLLSKRSSDWTIEWTDHTYLWNTMLFFFSTLAAPEIQMKGLDGHGWLRRAHDLRPTIHVSNVDLLFRIPHVGHWSPGKQDRDLHDDIADIYEEISFEAPGRVTSTTKESPVLAPNQVRMKSVCSLISSGTELKIFHGDFEAASLDTNIESMKDQTMTYPLAYGYSMVGRVVECGDDVEDAEELIGKLAFSFSPHATFVITDRRDIQIVPEGIQALDAIFMPSVETALSLVHEARPLVGEDIAVYGQGLIGLLVTAILRLSGSNCDQDITVGLGKITTVDTIPSRLAISALMGSSQAILPSEVGAAGPFDVAIEVSGSGRALQSAIDSTRKGGRVIIGSWYGASAVGLRLGIDFHRSHKSLKCSQVSEIPGPLRATWSKERRFQVTWGLVRTIRPSRLLTDTMKLASAQEAYVALSKAAATAIAFVYE